MNTLTYTKHFLKASTLVCLCLLCSSFTKPPLIIPADVASLYKLDANRIALRLLKESKGLEEQQVEIPARLSELVYEKLRMIYFYDHPAARHVIQKLKIHTFPVPATQDIKLVYSKDAKWASSLKKGNLKINDFLIKQYIGDYDLSIRSHDRSNSSFNELTLHTDKGLNMAVLAIKLSKLEGVYLVDLLSPKGDGNDIEVFQNSAGWQIDFIQKKGSCYNSCKENERWSFNIPDGKSPVYTGKSKISEKS